MRKKSLGAVALMAASAFLVAGIGIAPAQAATKVINVWADETRGPALKKFLEGKKYGGATVKITAFSSKESLDSAFQKASAANGPDIIFTPVGEAVTAAKSGKAAPIVLSATAKKNISAAGLAYGQYKSRQYGLALDIDGVAMIWNTKFGKAPTTFADFIKRFNAAKAAGTADYGICASDGSWGSLPLITALGGYTWGFDKSGNADPQNVGINDPAFASNLKKYAISGGKGTGLLRVNDWDTCSPSWLGGKTMALSTGSWRIDPTEKAGIKYTVQPVPTLDGKGYTKALAGFGGAWVTTFAAKHGVSAGAKGVMDYLASPEGSGLYSKNLGRPTPNAAAAKYASGSAKLFAAALSKTGTPQLDNLLGNSAGGSNYYDVLSDVFDKILVKGANVETTLDKAAVILSKNFAAGAKK